MNCENWHEQIAFHVDGEATSPALRNHLAGCAECRSLLNGLLADQALLRSVVVEETAPLPVKARSRTRWIAAVAAIAACVMVALFMPKAAPIRQEVAVVSEKLVQAEPLPAPSPAPRRRVAKPVKPVADWESFLAEFSPAPE